MTEDQLVEGIRRLVDKSSQKEVAERLGVAPQFLCDVLKRRRNVSETLAEALGYKREFMFRKL